MAPHSPVRLLLRGDARRFSVRTLVKPKRVPPVLMHGPQPKPPSYDNVRTLAKTIPIRLDNSIADVVRNTEVSTATVEWLRLARSEFSTFSGEDLAFRETRVARRSAVTTVASQWGTASAVSAVWRGLAKRTFEVSSIVARPTVDVSQAKMVQMHARAISRAIELVPKSSRNDLFNKSPTCFWLQ